jgi:hypothetical protein
MPASAQDFSASSASGPPSAATGPRPLPEALVYQYQLLEQWLADNKADEKSEARKLWGLKIPALILTSAASVLSLVKHCEVYAARASGIAGVCVTIDGFGKFGSLRSVHQQAVFDSSSLMNDVVTRWNISVLERADLDRVAVDLIKMVEKGRAKIQEYLKKAESK